jgi:drug/metabolite transporter (DMT)-like permease
MPKVDIATLLALSSALCVAVGDVLQQRAAHAVAEGSIDHIGLFVKLLKDRRWRIGAIAVLASIVLQAAALGEGSVLLVQPLLMLSLLFALPINGRLLGRAVTAGEWVWAGLLTAAVIVIVTVGHPQPGHYSAALQTWAAVAVVFGPVLVGCVLAAGIWRGAPAAVLLSFVSGSLWGVFAVLTEEFVHRLDDGGSPMVSAPELYAGLLAGLGGIVLGQAAFRAGPLTASMPTLEVTQPLVAAVLGVVVLGETLNTGPAGVIALTLAALVIPAAIVQLARVDGGQARGRVEESCIELSGTEVLAFE